jgi:PadR family transcriptional regulator, regulatory protein PadR
VAFDMNVWTTEIRRGIVEMCVLSVLQEEEGYGYEILERLRNEAEMELTESTIYPLLARLSKDGLLLVRVAKSPNGPQRRYYRVTSEGNRRLAQMIEHWESLNKSVSKLLKGRSK